MSSAQSPRRNYLTDFTGTPETHSEEQDSFNKAQRKTAGRLPAKYFIKYQGGNDKQRTDCTGHKRILPRDVQPASLRESLEDDYIGWAVYKEEHNLKLVRDLQHGELLEIRKVDVDYQWILYTELKLKLLEHLEPGELIKFECSNSSYQAVYMGHNRKLLSDLQPGDLMIKVCSGHWKVLMEEMLQKLRDLEPENDCQPADYTEHTWKLQSELQPGDFIEIPRGLYSHWAVYAGNGWVVHVAGLDGDDIRSAVHHLSSVFGYGYPKAEVRIDRFCDAVRGSEALKNNFLDDQMTPLTSGDIVRNAISSIGPTNYNILSENCEHFATLSRYGDGKNMQVVNGFLCLNLLIGAVAAALIGVSFFRIFGA